MAVGVCLSVWDWRYLWTCFPREGGPLANEYNKEKSNDVRRGKEKDGGENRWETQGKSHHWTFYNYISPKVLLLVKVYFFFFSLLACFFSFFFWGGGGSWVSTTWMQRADDLSKITQPINDRAGCLPDTKPTHSAPNPVSCLGHKLRLVLRGHPGCQPVGPSPLELFQRGAQLPALPADQRFRTLPKLRSTGGKKKTQKMSFEIFVWLEGNEKDTPHVTHLVLKAFLSESKPGLSNGVLIATKKITTQAGFIANLALTV